MKVVVLTSRFPYPLEKGDKLRIYHQVRVLAKDHEVLLICLNDTHPNEDAISHFSNIGIQAVVFKKSFFQKCVSLARTTFTTIPFQVGIFYSPGIKRKVCQHIHHFKPDIIYCHLLRMAPYAADLDYNKVVDYMDAFAYSMGKRANLVSFPASLIYKIESSRMKKYEMAMSQRFDAGVIISEQDRARLPFEKARYFKVIPNGLDSSFFTNGEETTKKYDIGFIGNLGYLPNIEAARYIIENIASQLPDCKVLICGARPGRRMLSANSEQITVNGWVEDIRDAYGAVKVFVAPIWSGTGQQNKILEAMAMGVPVVTTPEVNNAIGAIPGKEILIASNASEFQGKIKLLLSKLDLYHEIKNNALTFVRENYSWEDSVAMLVKVFNSI